MPLETDSQRLLRQLREQDHALAKARRALAMNPARQLKETLEAIGAPGKRITELAQGPVYRDAFDPRPFIEQVAGSKPSLPRPVPSRSNQDDRVKVEGAADIGKLVKRARRSMKLTQSDFAAHAGVGRRFVSELEGGKPTLEFDKVIACAIAAGIDVSAKKRGS